MRVKSTLGAAALFIPLILVAITWVGSRQTQTREVHIDAPYFGGLEELAANSTAIVEGRVVASRGAFDLRESGLPYAQDVYELQVTRVVARTDDSAISVGDVLPVSLFALSINASDIRNLEELREEVASFTGNLDVGATVTLFVSPLSPSIAEVPGWAIVGSYYGVFELVDGGYASRAPVGPLSEAKVTEDMIRSSLHRLGSIRPPEPTTGVPDDSGQTPRTGP